ncbi:N-terminal nucleophile aminohydrolase [Polychaeton citri CBS 116435]|uniref:N-terminal nucleophile aminohydrolase n=1 Tax=Polychaeton citri CBS 116435 TaxID=1314669 RepID=A0A9P4QHZ8_9PEZI|nr:N-terminal nucleophile aminohydrolase [Polychaeton citri CBS 116435]
MCRWFAYISPTEPCLLEDVLITPKHSLVKQVHEHYLPGLVAHDPLIPARNSVNNIDGMGVAWYTSSAADFELPDSGESSDGTLKEGLRPAAYKTIAPPINDLNFRSICGNVETRCCFAHIRAASGTPIVHTNNHPFIFGRHTMMHNGVISDFGVVKRDMLHLISDAAYNCILGSTDSEHLGALYMTYLTNAGSRDSFEKEYTVEEMADALHKAVATTVELQLQILGPKARPNSLNLCVTDGVKLVAYRFRNHATQDPPSLYFSTTAGTTLNRKYQDHPDGIVVASDASRIPRERHGKHIIVASEPTTYKHDEWELIGRNQTLLASPDEDGEGGKVQVRDIPYQTSWNTEDPSTAKK